MKKIFYFSSKAFFWFFTFFVGFILLFSCLSFLEYKLSWDIPFVDIFEQSGKKFVSLRLPLINMYLKFLISYTVLFMWFTFLYYSYFFFLINRFLKIFIKTKTFEKESVQKLKILFKYNFLPIIIGLVGVVLKFSPNKKFDFDEPHFFVIVHLIIAFFLYLYLDLINKGNYIQNDNDLTI